MLNKVSLVGGDCVYIVIVRLDKHKKAKYNMMRLVIGIGHQQLMLATGKSPYKYITNFEHFIRL